MSSDHSLESLVEEVFGYLVEDYGFVLSTRNSGREVYFDFDLGLDAVVVSIELGAVPSVMLLGPISRCGDRAEPWAEKDGIQRGMRVPELRVTADPTRVEEYLREMAEQLIAQEKDWFEQLTQIHSCKR